MKLARLTVADIRRASQPLRWLLTVLPFSVGYLSVGDVHWTARLGDGIVYFAVGYSLLFYGLLQLFGVKLAKAKSTTLWLLIGLVNVPFIVYFATVGTPTSTVWLLIMLFVACAYSIPGLAYRHVPGLDAITFAFFVASPFMFGILFAGGSVLYLAGVSTFFLWAMGTYTLEALARLKTDAHAKVASIATHLGAEKSIVFALSAYVAATVPPVIYYGWKGIFVSVVLLWYVVLAAALIPFRKRDSGATFVRAARIGMYMNYVAFLLVGSYLLVIRLV